MGPAAKEPDRPVPAATVRALRELVRLAREPAVTVPVLPEFVAVRVLEPDSDSVTYPVHMPSSVNSPSAMDVGDTEPESADNETGPVILGVVFLAAVLR